VPAQPLVAGLRICPRGSIAVCGGRKLNPQTGGARGESDAV